MTEPPPPELPAPPARGGIDPAAARLLRWVPFAMAGHLLVGLPALLISLVVAYGTFVQARATERMQQAATWPYLAYDTSNYGTDGKRRTQLLLTNQGVGPALLDSLEIRYRGRPIRTPFDYLAACCGYRAGEPLQLRTEPVSRVALRPGQELVFFELADVPANRRLLERAERERWQLRVRACYCSIFRECWIIDGRQSVPTPTPACPVNRAAYRER